MSSVGSVGSTFRPAKKDRRRAVPFPLHHMKDLSAERDLGGTVAVQEGPQEVLSPLPGLLVQVPGCGRISSRLDEFWRCSFQLDRGGLFLGCNRGPLSDEGACFVRSTGEEGGQGAAEVLDGIGMAAAVVAGVAGVDVEVSRESVLGLHAASLCSADAIHEEINFQEVSYHQPRRSAAFCHSFAGPLASLIQDCYKVWCGGETMNNPSRKITSASELAEILYNTSRLMAVDTPCALSALGLAYAAACHAAGLPQQAMVAGASISYAIFSETAANKERN